MIPGFVGTTLRRLLAGALALSFIGAPIPSPRPAAAAGYLTDSGVHAPPTNGTYAYYSTYGVFGPDQSGFPRQGESFVDPVFGSTIKRLTNEMGHHSDSEIYSKNGYFNANGTLVHHRSQSGHNIISTATGQVVRAGVAFNTDSSFAPDDPDAWYYYAFGDTTLYKYSVSTGARTVVKTFPGAIGQNGGSVDWIDRTGRYMVLRIGGATRVYDKVSDTLYAGSIPSSYGGGGGWISISPDANYVITSTPPNSSHSWKIDHANKSVSTSPVLFWTLCGGHADVVSASDGKTYFVSFDCHTTGSIYRADVSLPQSASNVPQQLSQNRKLVQLDSWADVDGHFSRVSKGVLQDWVFASVESGDDDFDSSVSSWRPYKQEIFMMNVLTGEMRRLAHHRSRGLTSSYYYQPRVNATWDGRLIAWTSNFGYNGTGYADLYTLAVDGAGSGGSTPPPPPPPASAPTVSFTNPQTDATVSGTVTVSLQASGGSGSGYTYSVKAGTSDVYTGTNNSFSWNTTSSANGSVTLTATVTDSAGTGTATRVVTVSNQSSTGGTGSSDTVPPTVTITRPTGTVQAGTSVRVRAEATDNVKLARLELWGAGKTFATFPCSSTSCTGRTDWSTGSLAAGSYIVNAVAIDAAGNRTVSAPVTIVKGAGPTVPSGATSTSTATTSGGSTTTATGSTSTGATPDGSTAGISTSSTDTTPPTVSLTQPTGTVWTTSSIQVGAQATDNAGLARIDLWGGGKIFATLPCSTTTCSGSVSWATGSLPAGSYEVNAVAVDKAGQRTVSATVTIVKDLTSPTYPSGAPITTAASTLPTVAITSPASGAWTGNSIMVSAAAAANVTVSTLQFYGDGSLFGTVSCPGSTRCSGTVQWLTGSLASGSHTVTAVATDSSGNRWTSSPVTILK